MTVTVFAMVPKLDASAPCTEITSFWTLAVATARSGGLILPEPVPEVWLTALFQVPVSAMQTVDH